MAFTIPPVGTEVEVCMKNPLMPTARAPYMKDFEWYRGRILKSLNWMGPDMFCLSRDDEQSPIRILDVDRVLDLRCIDGSPVAQVEAKAKPNFQMWQVDGSKGAVYNVTLASGKWSCDCPAGSFGRACKHVKKIQEELK